MGVAIAVVAVVAILILIILAASIRILREYERGVIFRLGRLIAQKGPGLILLIPFIDQMVRIDLRTITLNVPPQEVITKDNVTVRVNAVAYFRVIDPNKAVTEVENFLLATSQIAQTTLRSVLGKAELDALLSERERLNVELQQIIDEQTEPWGIKVSTVEVKDVELPADMQRAMSRQAEAERERRAKIIAADGEFQAAEKLSQAANIISVNPATLQLRYLQTLVEIGVNNSSTIVFPLPLDLLKPLLEPDAAPSVPPRASDPPRPPAPRHPDRDSPEIRIDQLTGLRAILAPGRAERPDAFDPRRPSRARTRPRAARSARAARTARRPRCGRTGPAAAARLRRAGCSARCRTSIRCCAAPRIGGRRRSKPGSRARSTRSAFDAAAEPNLFALPARRRRARGDRQRPRARDLARRARAEPLAGAVAAWRERMRAHGDAALRPPDRQRGPRRGRLARAHPRPALRARLRPRRGRPRARAAAAYHERTMGSHLLGDVAAEEIRRRERLVAVDDDSMLVCPWASRSPFELRSSRASPAPRFEDAEGGADDDRDRAPGARRGARRAAAAQPLGAHRAARGRGVLLARRHRPPADDQGRLRARHGGPDQRLSARARGGGPTCRARLMVARPPRTRPAAAGARGRLRGRLLGPLSSSSSTPTTASGSTTRRSPGRERGGHGRRRRIGCSTRSASPRWCWRPWSLVAQALVRHRADLSLVAAA